MEDAFFLCVLGCTKDIFYLGSGLRCTCPKGLFSLALAGTSSIDTTCTIWGLETGQVLGRVNLVSGHVKTQLIAHDKEVSG